MMTKTHKTILSLIKISISGEADELPRDVDWNEVIEEATKQGVLGICFDALEILQKNSLTSHLQSLTSFPDMDNLMDWLGQVSYMESMYEEHRKAIGQLAGFYASCDSEEGNLLPKIRLMVLKGYGVSLNYPKPEHRPVGDVDSYNFGLQEFADQMVHDKLGIEIDNSHHRHSVFTFHGVTVENHYDFIDDYAHRSNKRIEALLKAEVDKDCEVVIVDGHKVYLPSVRFNALFLLKHCAGHFAATEMTLRQLLDWLLFVRAHAGQIDWKWLYGILRKENLHRYADCLHAIGVQYLGFDAALFPPVEADKRLVDRVLNDILQPEFTEREDGSLLTGLWVKPRRWWHNRWKHKICYADSLFVDFFLNVYSKMLKPSHLKQ